MLKRAMHAGRVRELLEVSPVVALLGVRQVGKTTLAREVAGSEAHWFEFKRSSAPRRTRSMGTALTDLRLDTLDVLHAGDHSFPMGERIRAVAVGELLEQIEPL